MTLRNWPCLFVPWLMWRGYSKEYACRLSHEHPEKGPVNITARKLSKPRRSRSHFVRVVRKAVHEDGTLFPEQRTSEGRPSMTLKYEI